MASFNPDVSAALPGEPGPFPSPALKAAVAADHGGPSSPPVESRLILRVWLAVGCQSLGGGATTLTLIQRAVVEQQRWMTEAEFTRDWAICQLAPGINLLALTILIGRRTAGVRGIALALLGLLAPSVIITVAMTAGYSRVRHLHFTQSALRGIIPATVGLGLGTAWNLARPLLAAGRRTGQGSFILCVVLLLGSGAVVAATGIPIPVILAGAGAAGALAEWRSIRHRTREEAP